MKKVFSDRKTVPVRLERSEYEEIEKQARKDGVSVSEWIRDAANKKVAGPTPVTTMAPPKSPEPGTARVIGEDGLDDAQRYERQLCSDPKCAHMRQKHRGFGTCCQVIYPATCSCLGFDGIIVRPPQQNRPIPVGWQRTLNNP